MGTRKGSRRGPYRKRKLDENGDPINRNKPKSRSLIPCEFKYSDESQCHQLRYYKDYCYKHQDCLKDGRKQQKKIKQPRKCNYCDNMVEHNAEYDYMCTPCNNTTYKKTCDNELCDLKCKLGKDYCKNHDPMNICSIGNCKNKASRGKLPNRICLSHDTSNICTHVEMSTCKNKVMYAESHCESHGGKHLAKSRIDPNGVCDEILSIPCKRRIPFFRRNRIFNIIDKTKCIIHGGTEVCLHCSKPACIGSLRRCEDHEGTKCALESCENPVYIRTKNGFCHQCNYENKWKKKTE